MTEDERHDEVTRLLREQGPASAPEDLREEVMRRVRAEPRDRTSSTRRPVLTLLAAALVTVALVGGISRLDGGSTGSAGSGGAAETSANGVKALSSGDSSGRGATAPEAQHLTTLGPPVTFKQVPKPALLSLVNTYSGGQNGIIRDQRQSVTGHVVELYVANSRWQQVRRTIRGLAAQAAPDAPRVEVRLYRVPG
jgi:hypothetical protein